jgi:hypothetical protein
MDKSSLCVEGKQAVAHRKSIEPGILGRNRGIHNMTNVG